MEEKIKPVLKKLLKGAIAALALTLAVVLISKVVGDLYDYRIILGVLAGKLGFDLIYNKLSTIKGLE